SLLTFDINGSYNDGLLIKGRAALKGSIFNRFNLYVIYNKERLILKELNIDNHNFKDLAYYSFSNKNIHVDIESPHIKNNLFEAKNVRILVDGMITDPSFNIYGELLNVSPGRGVLNIKGDLRKAKADFNFKDYSLNIDYKRTEPFKFLIGINAQYKEKITLSLPLKVKYLSDFAFNITARKGSINIQPLGEILLNDIQFFADKKGIKGFNCNISNEIFKNMKLIDVDINEKGIKGDIDLNNGILEYNNMFLLKTVGGVGFYYNYKDPVMLSGEVNGRGKVNWEGLYLKLPINKFNIKFDGLNITFNAVLNELDSYLNISYKTNNYMDYLDSSLDIKGKHIYINKLGFSGMFNLDLSYDSSERKLKGDVFLVKSYYDVGGYVKTTSAGTSNIKLPVDINLNVKTINPVKIDNKYANANVNVNLNVIYDKELKVFGKLYTSDSYITIGQEKLVIFDNYILFRGTLPPYLYLEARGTGNYSYIVLKITGNLPNYNISIIDLNPSNRGLYETKSSYNPQNLITDIFAGVLLGDLLNVTENIIGINSIGFEQSNVEGEYINSLKIGRRFSDRFEVNYVVNTSSDEEGGEVVGEYSLLDWFKLICYSENRGGSGFGFSFFTDF
ncbi:MAG: translocation/assembly module TamB domain-containing protein, partial [Deferribacterota bacterium]|nr:translocation/assembly module TamB domain-containing protein [Deferribacterota bacterium]